jgi:hypothetical protein
MKYMTVLAALFVAGCVSAAVVPDKQVIGAAKHVRVVAMEAPPLSGLPAKFQPDPHMADAVTAAQQAVVSAQLLGSFATVGGATSVQGAQISGIATIVLIAPLLAEATINSYCNEPQATPSHAIPLPKGMWVATSIAATEAQTQLSAVQIDATLEPGLKPFTCVHDRRPTLLMENWYAPIRAWYNDNEPDPYYVDPPSAQGAFVLEVAVLNYELSGDHLLLQVMVRLIDTRDGRPIGRARAGNAWHMPEFDSIDEAFSGEALPFKAVLTTEARLLVRDCLVQLGLISAP